MSINITTKRRYVIYDVRNKTQSLVELDMDMYELHTYLNDHNWRFHFMDSVKTDDDPMTSPAVRVFVHTDYKHVDNRQRSTQ